jgi:hypothetical protein
LSIENHITWLLGQLKLESKVRVDGEEGPITTKFKNIINETIFLVEQAKIVTTTAAEVYKS